MRSGFVSIIGRPNVGKSTLLNSLMNEKIAITSDKPGTTRNIIQGIYNEKDTQIVFVDSPGIHKPINKLGKILNKEALSLTKEIDVILLLIDASVPLGNGDKYVINLLRNKETPVILVLNKIDKITDDKLILKIEEYKDLYSFAEIVPISALKNDNVERLIEVIKKYLVDECRYFDVNTKTSSSKSFMISEFVREKILELTEEEVPYGITCFTSKYEDKKNIINIYVDIIVDRDSLKKIIIGKQGAMIKEIGIRSRKDIEEFLGKKIYLELYVKTIKNWKEKDRHLTELGFKDFE